MSKANTQTQSASTASNDTDIFTEEGAGMLTAKQRKAVGNAPNLSARIRVLLGEGMERSKITQVLLNASGGPLRYQHVRNVEVTPTKAAS